METRSDGARSAGAAGDVVTEAWVSGRWRVTVDSAACIGSGMCVGLAPDVFRLDGLRSVARCEVIHPSDQVLAAADSCPAEAISVREVGSGTLLAPCD